MEMRRDVDRFFTEMRARKLEKENKNQWKARELSKLRKRERQKNFGKSSKIISMLGKSYTGKFYKERDLLRLVVPETFSIIESPETVIGTIGQFAKSIREQRPRNIYLEQNALKIYDLAANGLLDVVAVELEKETKQSRRKTRWRGGFPDDSNVKRFIKALGITKHLGLDDRYPVDDAIKPLRVFDRRNRHYYGGLRPEKADFKTKVVVDFADHINSCLGSNNLELTNEALHKLCSYTSEIIDNAEEHAGMLDWSIQGYLDTNTEVPFCEIAIFNFGETISESLSKLPKESYTWLQISPYLHQHKKKSLFGPSWSETDLLTVIALQGGVSRDNTSVESTRGNGTIDLIEFFQLVHKECMAGEHVSVGAKMAILSGSTHILFDGTYQLIEEIVGEKAIKRITFNTENSLETLPDPKYVRRLKGIHFPGTIISIRFPMGKGSTVNRGEKNDSE